MSAFLAVIGFRPRPPGMQLAALLVACALAGCGQKGQLYLPSSEPASVEQSPVSGSAVPAEPEDPPATPASEDPETDEAGKDDR